MPPFATEGESRTYSFEQERVEFDDVSLRRFKANRAAWTFSQTLQPRYSKRLTWWVASAKREETRETRLEKLIQVSAMGKRVT